MQRVAGALEKRDRAWKIPIVQCSESLFECLGIFGLVHSFDDRLGIALAGSGDRSRQSSRAFAIPQIRFLEISRSFDWKHLRDLRQRRRVATLYCVSHHL